jgi:hypothetical protein
MFFWPCLEACFMIDSPQIVIEQVRDHYVAAYVQWVEQEMAEHQQAVPELKFELPQNKGLFQNLYCARTW